MEAQLPPGTYSVVAELGGVELGRDVLSIGPGCWRSEIRVAAPVVEMPPLAIIAKAPGQARAS